MVALLQHLAHGTRGTEQRREVGDVLLIDGRGHGHDEEFHVAQVLNVGCEVDVRAFESFGWKLIARVFITPHHVHALGVDVEAHHFQFARESQRDRQAHVAQADHGQLRLLLLQPFK
jgi:hypothetical protein